MNRKAELEKESRELDIQIKENMEKVEEAIVLAIRQDATKNIRVAWEAYIKNTNGKNLDHNHLVLWLENFTKAIKADLKNAGPIK